MWIELHSHRRVDRGIGSIMAAEEEFEANSIFCFECQPAMLRNAIVHDAHAFTTLLVHLVHPSCG